VLRTPVDRRVEGGDADPRAEIAVVDVVVLALRGARGRSLVVLAKTAWRPSREMLG
jgi:hypothetical protein